MALYEIDGPDGKTYSIEGPEGATREQVIGAIQQRMQAPISPEPQYKPRGIDYIQELPKGIVGGIAGILESAALGGATLLPEKYEAPVREKIQAVGDVAQSFVTPDTGLEQAIPRKFGEALGSFTGILGTSLIPGVGIPAAGALAVGAGAGEASERAREAGATQEERTKASLLGAGVGATEILPIGVAFNRAKSIFKALPEKKTKELTDRILDVGLATTVEGAQEASAAILQNMIEQGYNPEQDTFEGAVEQGAYGAGVGGTVQTVLNFIDGRRNVAPKDDGSTDTTKEPDEIRATDGKQRVKDAVEGKVKLPSFDDFRRGQVEQQQEGKRFREDFVDPLKAETDDAGIDTTGSGVGVPSDRPDAPKADAVQVGSAKKVDAPAGAGLGRLGPTTDAVDAREGPEASALTPKEQKAIAEEQTKVKEPEPVITPTSDAGNVKPNVKTKFDPKADATLVDRRTKADPDPSKLGDVTTISGGTKEKDITSPAKTRKQFDSIGYQGSKPEIGDLQETVKTKYKNSFPNIKIFGNNTSWDAAHMDGGVAIEYTQTKDKSRVAYLMAHELGHASHSLLGNKVNKNPNIKTELKAIENFIYPNLREQIKTAEAQNKNIDTEFFNYLLSPEELIAEFNVYRVNNETQVSTIAPNLSKLLASVEADKNLVKPRNVFTGSFDIRREVDGFFNLESNPLIDEERIRNLEGKTKPFVIGLDKKYNDFKVAKKDNPKKALDIYNTFIKGRSPLDDNKIKKEVAELEKKLAAPEVKISTDTLSPEETVVAYVNDPRIGRDTVVKKIQESPELSKRAVTGLPEGDTIPVYRFIAYDKKTKPKQEKLVSASLTPKGSAAFVKLATQSTMEATKNRVGDVQRVIRYDVPRKDIKAYMPALSDSLEQKHNKKVKELGIGKALQFSKKIENPVDYAKNLIKEQQEVLVDVSNLKGRVLKTPRTGAVDFNLRMDSTITNKIRDEEIKTSEDFNQTGYIASGRMDVTLEEETKARQDLIDEVRSFYNLDQKKLAAPEVETPNMKQRLAAARTRMQAIGISKSITSSYVKDYNEATAIDAKTSILSEMENVSQQDLKKKRIAGERELKKAEEKETTARVEEDLKKEEAIEKAETLTEAQKKFIADRRKREAVESEDVDREWRQNFNKTASDKDKLIDEQYDIERTDDPVAIKDKRILLDLVTGKLKGVSTDKDMAAAKTYFSKVGNPANALDNIAFDIEHSDKNYRTPDDIEFIKNNYGEELLTTFAPDYDPATDKLSNEALINFQLAYDQHLKGTGEKFGLRAYAWMKKNLSRQTLDAFKKIKRKETDEKSDISRQNSSDSGILRTLGKKSTKKLKNNPYDLFYDLPTAQISTLAMKLHPRVRAILRAGDLRGALEEIGLNPTLPKEITDLAKKLGEKLVDKKYLDKIKAATQDSKVKDIVYHGSPKKDITEFKPSDYTQGLYFSPNKGLAEDYVAHRSGKTAKDGRVYEVMLDIKKPLMIKGTDKISLLDKIDLALGRKTKKELREAQRVKGRASMTLSKERIAELKRQGYDGIMNEDMMEYVAFDASQVYIVNDPDSITKVRVNEKIKEETAGRFNPKTNTIEINPASGMNTHVLLHEVYHAVTSATLANKSHPLTKQLNALYNEVKPYLGTAYGAQSLDEFVSESQSNTEFRQELASINIKGQPVTALQRLNNILVNFLRRLIGRDTVPLTALESASPLIESIMEPAPKTRNASILQMKTDQTGVKEVMANIGSTVKELSTVQGSIDQGKDFLLNGKIFNGFKDFFLAGSDSVVAAKLGNEVGFKDEDGKSLGMMVHNISTRTRGKLGESHDKSNELLRDITTFARKYPEQYAAMNDYTYNNKYGATLFGVYRVKGFESTYLRSDNKTSKLMTLGDEKIKLKDIYDAQTPSWNGMNKDGANGQELLERIRQHYQKEFRALKDILFGRVNDTLGEKSKEAKQLRNTLSKIFEDKSILIYFPLVREGRYAIPYKLTNEASEGRINDDVFELISTKAAAERRYEELKNDPNVLKGPGSLKDSAEAAIVDTSKKSLSETFKVAPPAGFVAEVLTTVDKNPKAKSQTKADKDEIAALKEEIVNLYINTLPETSFAKSFAGRKNVLGYIDDTTTAFKKKGFEIPYSRIRLENSKLLLDVERKIREKAKILREEPVVKKDTFLQRRLPEVTRMENELLARSEFNRKGATGPLARYESIARNLNQGAFIYTIGFNVSSAVVNLSQVPLFVLPYQAAKYGLSGSMGAVGRATKYISASRADIGKYFDKNYNVIGDVPDAKKQEVGAYADIVKAAAENGMLQITSIAEFMGLQESGQRDLKTIRGKVDGVVAASAYAFNFAERMNRQVTLLSTYELVLRKKMNMQDAKNFSDVVNAAKNEPLKIQEAVEQAMIETQETNGGHAIETAPRIFQQGVGRVAGMYKSYGVKMYSTMLQSTIQAINTDLPSDIRKVAIKQLIGVHGSALFFAGIHGIPIYGAVELFSNLFLLDDEEDDFNTIVRKHVGEGWYKGPLNQLAGTDVASRIRLTGLLIQQNRFNPDASVEENAFFYLGGPAYSTVKRVGRGLKDLSEGEVERGFESLMPAAVSNMYRTVFGRLAREGYKTRRGDPIYDDVTGGDLAFQFFGFAPVEYTFRQEQNNILKRIDTVTNRKRTKLLRKYYVSTRNGDYSETRKAIDAINKFNKRHPLAAITTDSVARSMRTHKKTSEKMAQYNGVSISPRMKAEIDANRNEWDSYDMA